MAKKKASVSKKRPSGSARAKAKLKASEARQKKEWNARPKTIRDIVNTDKRKEQHRIKVRDKVQKQQQKNVAAGRPLDHGTQKIKDSKPNRKARIHKGP